MLGYYGAGFFIFFILLPEYFSYVTFFSAFVLISRKSIFLLSMSYQDSSYGSVRCVRIRKKLHQSKITCNLTYK